MVPELERTYKFCGLDTKYTLDFHASSGLPSVALTVHAVSHVFHIYIVPAFVESAETISSTSTTVAGRSVQSATSDVPTDTENVFGFQYILIVI